MPNWYAFHMSYQIRPASTVFRFGFSDAQQLRDFFQEQEFPVGLAFTGRSNVGKSTLINSLFGKQTARTSKTPGRTREVNVFEFELFDPDTKTVHPKRFWLFDLPGYGHAQISKEMAKNWDDLMTTFFTSVKESIRIVNVQDARHPDQDADREFHHWLSRYPLRCSLAFNKLDKLKTQKDRAILNKLKPQLSKDYSFIRDIHFISAEKGQGLPPFKSALVSFLLEAEARLDHA